MRPGGSAALPATYSVNVGSMSFGELPMSEAAARQVHRRHQPRAARCCSWRGCSSQTQPSEIHRQGTRLRWHVARVTVLKDASLQRVGILYDDHSLPPAEVKVIPSAISTMKSTREFNEEIITAVYVSLAADACGWQITPEQKANLKRYISSVRTYGKFHDRSDQRSAGEYPQQHQ